MANAARAAGPSTTGAFADGSTTAAAAPDNAALVKL